MFLDIYNNNGIRFIRISESYRINKNGVRVARKRQVKSIGAVSRFDDGKPDFEQRLKDSFKAGNPLIPELEPYVKKDIQKVTDNAVKKIDQMTAEKEKELLPQQS